MWKKKNQKIGSQNRNETNYNFITYFHAALCRHSRPTDWYHVVLGLPWMQHSHYTSRLFSWCWTFYDWHKQTWYLLQLQKMNQNLNQTKPTTQLDAWLNKEKIYHNELNKSETNKWHEIISFIHKHFKF